MQNRIKFSAILTLLLAMAAQLGAAPIFPYRSSWKYFVGTAEASTPTDVWRFNGFDDSSWQVGNSPVGYPSSDASGLETTIQTVLPTSTIGGYTCVFLRKTFVLSNPAEVTALVLNLQYDDGYAAWVNGVEIGRSAGVTDPITRSTVGTDHEVTVSEGSHTLITSTGGLLVVGTNVVAVQVFNSGSGSSDLFIDATLSSTLDEPPTLLALDPVASSIVPSLTFVTVTFSEAVSGVDASDLTINGVTSSFVAQNNSREFTFNFSQPATGAVTIAWSANPGIADQDGTPNPFVPGPAWTYTLDPNLVPQAAIISEFLSDNENGVEDEDGTRSDWIEIYNPGLVDVNLGGWFLTDSATNLTKWRFPSLNVAANKYLLVWASEKNRTNPAAPLHTNFRLSRNAGSYLALVDAQTNVVSEFSNYPAQLTDNSYGRDRVDPGLVGFFVTPTPGAQNSTSGAGFAPEPVLSLESGVYTNASLTLTITAPAGVTMIYTLNGTVPTNGSPVYSAPLSITANSTVKVRGTQAGFFPSAVQTRNFLFLDATTRDFNSNLPILVLSSEGRTIVTSARPGAPRTKGTFMVFDTFRGRSALQRKPDYQGPADFEVFGQTSAGFAKRPFNIEIQDDLGNDKAVSILGMPEEADWKLRNPYADKCLMNDFLAYEMFEQMGNYSVRRKMVEVFVDEGGGRLAYPGDYIGVEVFLEKIERGKDRVDIAELTPAHTNQPSITGGYMFKKDKASEGDLNFTGGGVPLILHEPKPNSMRVAQGATTSWPAAGYTPSASNQMTYLVSYLNAFNTAMNAATWTTATGTNHYSYYIDVDSFVDQHWIVEFPKQIDGYRISNFYNKDRNGKVKPVPIWDWNLAFGNADYLDGGNTNQWYYTQTSAGDHPWLRRLLGASALPNSGGDPDFIQKVIDRWGVLRTNVMNGDRVNARIDEIAALLTDGGATPNPATRNFSKYNTLGTYLWPNPPGTGGNTNAWHVNYWVGITSYGQIIDQMKKWVTGRYLWIDGLFPKAPSLTLNPGNVAAGSSLSMTAPAGTIYYTTDGSDPRQAQNNGAVAAGALTYTGPVTINANIRIFARARNGTVWSPPTIGTYVVQTPQLVITEIMYHPQDPPVTSTNVDADFEYIELKNIGTSALNLNGYSLSNGVDFLFPNVTLNAGQRILVVANQAAFTARYGAGFNIAGQFTGNLENEGERIVLEGRFRERILDFSYDDDWHPITDGFGFSLVIDNENAAADTWGLPASWRPSALNGTPGQGDGAATSFPRVVVNEALSHSDPPPPTDTIELRNLDGTPADIGGWFLTDDFRNPKKYRIPNGTTIPANSYLTFDEGQFNTPSNAPTSFGLSSSGDEVYLFSGNASTNLTGYHHGFAFGAAKNGVTFGRHITSLGEEHFVAESSATLGTPNSGPLVGPIVISEVMYRPQDVLANGAYWNNTEDEFIELHNISGNAVQLFDPMHATNTWKLDKAVEFDFPPSTSIPPGGYLLVVNFNPVTDIAQLNAFRTKFGVNPAIPLLGPYKGSLDNKDEAVALYMPDTPEISNSGEVEVPYVLADQVAYGDQTPWPVAADGLGHSLQRVNDSAYGDDPMNWAAGSPSPGAVYVSGSAPAIATQPVSQTVVGNTSVMLSASATGVGPLSYQWRFNGGILNGATNSVLMLPSVAASQAGRYQLVALNPYGSAVSTEATLTVLIPVNITQGPFTQTIREGSNVTFAVAAASGNPPISFQWFFNGAPIGGATASTYNINGVTDVHDGDYSVVCTDAISTAQSAPAHLTVLIPPQLLTPVPPLNITAVVGDTVTLSGRTRGTKPVWTVWRRFATVGTSGNIVTQRFVNANTDFLTLNITSTNQEGRYSMLMTNIAGGALNTQHTNTFLTILADTDGDRIPDIYETANGLDPNSAADGTTDTDGDTMPNRDEYIAGTNPNDVNSYLKVEHISATGMANIDFLAMSNRTYSVIFKDNINGGIWSRLADTIAHGTNRVERVTDSSVVSGRVYRLVTPRQP